MGPYEGEFFLRNLSRQFILTVKIKSSECERSIDQIFCEFDFVRLCSAIELNPSMKFDCVRLTNVRLDTPGFKAYLSLIPLILSDQ